MKTAFIIIVVVIIGFIAWNGYQARRDANLKQAANVAFNQCMNDVRNSTAYSRQLDCKIDGEPQNCALSTAPWLICSGIRDSS